MKFEEVLPALREGKKITSEHLKKCGYQYIYYRDKTMFDSEGGYWHLADDDFVERGDWEIVKDKKKVKLRDLDIEEYIKYGNGCTKRICAECPLHSVECSLQYSNCWIKHKDLYSDKFLDQEIEIEE